MALPSDMHQRLCISGQTSVIGNAPDRADVAIRESYSMARRILFVHLVGFCRFDAQMMTSMLHEQQRAAAIARWHGFRLTKRCSQPLAGVSPRFDFTKQLSMLRNLAPAQRWLSLFSSDPKSVPMPVTAEEEVVLLYALHACGGHPSKSRATEFIVSSHLMKERTGDYDTVSTDESRVENRVAWTRQNLKDKGQLAMPEHGTWQITPTEVERLKKVAQRSLSWEDDDLRDLLGISWQRFSPEFLIRLQALGRKLQDGQ